jgi:hypothetical protein
VERWVFLRMREVCNVSAGKVISLNPSNPLTIFVEEAVNKSGFVVGIDKK